MFCGIGNPQEFKNTLEKYNFRIKKKIFFPDHYKISKKDDVIHFSALNTFIRGFAILLGGVLAGLLVESKFIFELANNYNLIPIHLSMLASVILRLFFAGHSKI